MKRATFITMLLVGSLAGSSALAQHGNAEPAHGAAGHAGHADHAGHAHEGEGPEAHNAAPGLAAGEGAAHHGEAGSAEHHLPSINWTQFGGTLDDGHGGRRPAGVPFLAPVINFLLLLAILYMAVKRVINPALATRRAAVESEMGEAQRLRAEAEAVVREYTDKLKGLDAEIAALRAEFVTAGERERDRIVEEARVKAERMRREGDFAIQQEIKQLRSDLIREAVDTAMASAETAVRTQANAQDQARLADEYLTSLERSATIVTGAKA